MKIYTLGNKNPSFFFVQRPEDLLFFPYLSSPIMWCDWFSQSESLSLSLSIIVSIVKVRSDSLETPEFKVW